MFIFKYLFNLPVKNSFIQNYK